MMYTEVTKHTNIKEIPFLKTCECYPNHCTDGINCWCDPDVHILFNNRVIIHRYVNTDKTKLD